MRPLAKIGLRILAGLGVLFLGLITLVFTFRLALAEWALRHALADVGASPRQLRVTEVRPSHVVIAPLAVAWRGQQVHADSITLDRPDLFSRSLGHIKVEGISVVLDLRALGVPGEAPAAKETVTPGNGALLMTFDDLSLDGHFVVQGAGPDQLLTFDLEARPDTSGKTVHATLKLKGPGLDAVGRVDYDLVRSAGGFEVTNARTNLADLQAFLEKILSLPLGGWRVGGALTATAQGRLIAGRISGQAILHLREGALRSKDEKMTFEGISGDVMLAGPEQVATPPAQQLQMARGIIGNIELRDATVRFQLRRLDQLWVESAEAGAFGGRLAIEPFGFDPMVVDYHLTLRFEGVRIEDLLVLFPMTDAKATGLADGQLPVHFRSQGPQFGHGWLALKAGTGGTLHINQPGLITGSLSPKDFMYPTMKGIETGMNDMRVTEMRAEIYPPDAPADRSVQMRINGTPVNSNVQAISFDVNVNGPVEKLIRWGLDTRLQIQTR